MIFFYSSSKSFFNGRDQVMLARQYAGTDTSSTFQDTTMSYDGYGRLKTQHRPEQDANTATTYNYNIDNSIQSVVDARGATTNYIYNNLGLLTQLNYNSSDPNIPATPPISFTYDSLGNRTNMTDGFGTITYQYSQLSQLTSETRIFSSSLTDAPQSANGFTHTYNYHLGGGLKTITYPNQVTLNYGLDKAGKLRTIDGASENQAISVLSNVDYRAWGSPKAITFGNGNVAEMTYNNKLSPDTEKYTGKKGDYYNGYYTTTTVDNKYNYYADGSLRLIEDNTDTSTFHYKYRSQKYDNVGRLVAERSGNEALGTANLGAFTKYGYNFGYNEFGNLTSNQDATGYNSSGGAGQTIGDSTALYTYTNNRIVARGQLPNGAGASYAPVPYDSEGRVLSLEGFNSTFDQAGQLTKQTKGTAVIQDFWYDGNGNQAKTKEVSNATEDTENFTNTTTRYVVFSSVLGEAIEYQSNIDSRYPTITNHQTKTHFYGFGGEIAWQVVSDIANGVQKTIELRYKTSFEAQRLNSEISGATSNGLISKQEAISSRGLEFLKIKPQPTTERGSFTGNTSFDADFNEWLDGEGCALDGVIVPCSMANRAVKSGGAMPSVFEKYQRYKGFRYEEIGMGIYQASLTLPDIYARWNNDTKKVSEVFAVPHGQNADGERIFVGGTATNVFTISWNRTWRTGSWERGQQNGTPLTDGDISSLRDDLKQLVSQAKCAQFLADLLGAFQDAGRAKSEPDILAHFDNFFSSPLLYEKMKGNYPSYIAGVYQMWITDGTNGTGKGHTQNYSFYLNDSY